MKKKRKTPKTMRSSKWYLFSLSESGKYHCYMVGLDSEILAKRYAFMEYSGPTLARGRRFNNKSYTAPGAPGSGKPMDLADVSNLYTGDISQINSKGGVMKGANQKKRIGGGGGPGGMGQYQQKQKRENAGIPKTFVEQEQEAAESEEAQKASEKAEDGSASASWETAMKRKVEGGEDTGEEEGKGDGKMSLEEVRRNLNPSEVPEALTCALDRSLLREAVLLPCCYRTCSLPVIREALAASNNICPLCNKPNITPDQLVPNKELRGMVDSFLESKRDAPKQLAQNNDNNESNILDPQDRDRLHHGHPGPRGPPFFAGRGPPFPPFDGPRPGFGWEHFPPRGPMHRGPGPWMHHGPNPPRGDGPWMHHDRFHPMDRDPRWRPPMDAYPRGRRSNSPRERSRSMERRKRSRSRSPRRDRSRSPRARRGPPKGRRSRERGRSRGRRPDDHDGARRRDAESDSRRREDRRAEEPRDRRRKEGSRRRERSPPRGGGRDDKDRAYRSRRRPDRSRAERGRRRR